MFEKYKIQKKTLFNVLSEQKIKGVFYLKIDTEGHECVILSKFFKDVKNNNIFPHRLLFESNCLSEKNRCVKYNKNIYVNKI